MNKEYWFSVLIQDADTINEIDTLRDENEESVDFNICEEVVRMFEGFSENADNFTDYEPYICYGRDFIIETYREYVLVRSLGICDDYMLYRKATEQENEWFNDVMN